MSDLPLDWLTNDPQAAAQLRAADASFDAARRAASVLPLAEKVVALRKAKIARAKDYADIYQRPQAYPDREITDAEKRRNAGGRHGHYGLVDRNCDQCIEDGS